LALSGLEEAVRAIGHEKGISGFGVCFEGSEMSVRGSGTRCQLKFSESQAGAELVEPIPKFAGRSKHRFELLAGVADLTGLCLDRGIRKNCFVTRVSPAACCEVSRLGKRRCELRRDSFRQELRARTE